jgi:hypothetical protein
MFTYTDIQQAPWWVVKSDDKRRARLNCIHHLLSAIPYEQLPPRKLKLQPRQENLGYLRPPETMQNFLPEVY